MDKVLYPSEVGAYSMSGDAWGHAALPLVARERVGTRACNCTVPAARGALTRSVPVLAGKHFVEWKGVCSHFGWDKARLCGPVTMALSGGAGNCPYGHEANSPMHNTPKVNGAPFKLQQHAAALKQAGLLTTPKELESERAQGKPPPGQAKKVNGTLVFPARHFA